ncbi:hypothetical protein Nepgr_013860 [Nepenthes gracilis]|uniref:WLM domain-containing protein n=1 Tax=Nepenthes gracilis TaxID=150966 RepID=A0AAD3SJT2_NEPGR|nr:hypothetical protein Nepgr_013860 [Nepenthes gracilis]
MVHESKPGKHYMEHQGSNLRVPVIWRGMKLEVEITSGATLKELGDELQKLTDVKADTIRLIVPQSSNKSSTLFSPFSDEHSYLRLQDTAIAEAKSIRMMGVSENEVDEVLRGAKLDLRIAGFEEEEKRMRLRMSNRSQPSFKLPQGPYIFCAFRTLELPGIKLNPPASEALKRMHMLAADPGIVAIMNKHRWTVGIMTEMAPTGYVGISPKCILGLNKNHGEEISLRLRTDDLKGFRKYDSIKKTLLHELAHMVYSEHDAKFYALDKQLNQEAASLDWTRSKSHTLTKAGASKYDHKDENFESESTFSQKLGGKTSDMPASARAASVAAAHHRLEDSLAGFVVRGDKEPDPDDSVSGIDREAYPFDIGVEGKLIIQNESEEQSRLNHEPDPDDFLAVDGMELEPNTFDEGIRKIEPDPDDTEMTQLVHNLIANGISEGQKIHKEPDPDDSGDFRKCRNDSEGQNDRLVIIKEDLDDKMEVALVIPRTNTDEPDPDDQELQRIQDPVNTISNRLTTVIEMMHAEVGPAEAGMVLQTLFKIIRNVIEHPTELKYRKLRKANPVFRRTIAYCKAAMDILSLIGFNEDVVFDEIGKAETYLVLKRNDPGLLWLAKSSLETCIA